MSGASRTRRAAGRAVERLLGVPVMGVMRLPTSFPASRDGSLKDVWDRAVGARVVRRTR